MHHCIHFLSVSLCHFPLYCTLSSSHSPTFFPNSYWFVFLISHPQAFNLLNPHFSILLYSIFHFSHSSFHENIFLKIWLKIRSLIWVRSSKIRQMFCELCLLTLMEVFLVRLDSFPCITFCPSLCSSNVTKTPSGWPQASDLLMNIWHQCSLNVSNHKICWTALTWAVHLLLWWQQSFLLQRGSLYSHSSRASSVCILVCRCPSPWWSWQTHTYVLKLLGIALKFWKVSCSLNLSL